MGKMSSIWKKVRPIIKEANELKNEKEYEKAMKKYREAITYIRLHVKDPKESKADINNITSKIDETYSSQIEDIIEQAKVLTEKKSFEDALNELNNALNIGNNIDNSNLKDKEKSKVKFSISETELKSFIERGIKEKNEQNFEAAIETLNKALNDANNLYSSNPDSIEIINIKDLINQTYSDKIKLLFEKGHQLKQNGRTEEAIKVYEDAMNISENMFDSELKEMDISNIENLFNQISSEQIEPLIEQGKLFLDKNKIDEAIRDLKKALNIVNNMYESGQKRSYLNKISEIVNPIYADKMRSVKEKGMQLIKKDNFEDSISIVNEAAETFKKALDIVNEMVESKQKDKELEFISGLINQTCLAGIKVRKEKGNQFIKEKNFEKAISEMYSAINIAKNMAYQEDSEKEIENIKKLVNEVYSAQIKKVLEEGEILLNRKKYDEAREIFNEAMEITNKMYLSEEMDREVGNIKNLIYQTEMKQVVSEGYISEELKKFEKEIEELKEKLERANSIKDPDQKSKKISEVKHLIDRAYSEQIKLLIEHGNQLAEQMRFDEARQKIDKALKFVDLIEYPIVKDNQLVQIINVTSDYGNQLANIKKFDKSFVYFEKALSIAEIVNDKTIKNDEITKIKIIYEQKLNKKVKNEINNGEINKAIEYCNKAIALDESFVESYYNMGNAYINKIEYDNAIKYFEKAVKLDPNLANAWNDMSLAYELKNDYKNALRFIDKAVKIDPLNAIAWYRMGNMYNFKQKSNKAIECYKKAIDSDPEFAKAWLFIMATSYFEQKNYYRSIEYIKKIIELNPDIAKELRDFDTDFKNSVISLQTKLSKMFKGK